MISDEMVERAHRAVMSELFMICQPDRGDVFSFMDDHPEVTCAALKATLPPDTKDAIKDSDVAELVERLQADDAWQQDEEFYIAPLLRKAADLITRLSAELAEARVEREDFEFQLSDALCGEDAERTRATAAEAKRAWLQVENERLLKDCAEYDRSLDAHEDEVDSLREALKDTLAHLVAAHSLLSRSPKTAAPSDKMFDQMLKDYASSIERGRAALGEKADG